MSVNRATIEKTLAKFETLIAGLNVHTYNATTLSLAKEYLGAVKIFLDKLAPAVNTFEVGGTLTQSMADKYKSDLATARFSINESIEDITSFESALQGSVADIAVQESRVKAAEANVRGYNAELGKRSIVAPFSGILSRQDAKVGQAVGSNESVAALISKNLEIEVYVPEVSLPGIAAGNNATVVLDAYPDETFEAKVIHIDPAETQKDGVSNYKVRLSLQNTKSGVVSGLTSDVFIETERKQDILSLPVRSVATIEGKTYFYKKQGKDFVKTEVTLGTKDGKGNIEVISGASDGDVILVNPPQA
jgi:RND family efflux transporter MFP subunit